MNTNSPGTAATKRILVVEDEAATALDLEQVLRRLGYDVVGTAANASRALALAGEFAPDLVLMDIVLAKGDDGVALAQLLREQLGIAVVFLTAQSSDETLARALRADPFGYVLKPFSAEDLRCTIEVALYKRQTEGRLVDEARTDPLTKLANRRGLAERVSLLMKEGRRGREFVVALVDVDNFKNVNDTKGHGFGDQVLVGLAGLIKANQRDVDFAARLGGDEFCVVLVDVDAARARPVLERMRRHFAEMAPDLGVGASIGACVYRKEMGENIDAMLERADRALYRAKSKGRNCVEVDAA